MLHHFVPGVDWCDGVPRMKCQISCNSILGCGPVWEKFRWGKWKVSQLCICRGPTIIMWRVLYFVVIFVVLFFCWLCLLLLLLLLLLLFWRLLLRWLLLLTFDETRTKGTTKKRNMPLCLWLTMIMFARVFLVFASCTLFRFYSCFCSELLWLLFIFSPLLLLLY